MKRAIRIGLVEDHLSVRQGYVALFELEESIKVIFDVATGQELFEKLKKTHIDVLLLDIEMPSMDGKTILKKIKSSYPEIKVIMLTGHDEKVEILECIRSGASSYIIKDTDFSEMVDAIDNVFRVGSHVDKRVTKVLLNNIRRLPNKDDFDVSKILSEKEKEMIRYFCKGLTSKEIGEIMNLSHRTIEGAKLLILEKTKCKNTIDLAFFAYKNDIYHPNQLKG
ncbi:MAG: response regulator transcription factor [Flavobacteriales bacterium]|nr:response regulator transcription factor [Flavobacteriales bacterium]